MPQFDSERRRRDERPSDAVPARDAGAATPPPAAPPKPLSAPGTAPEPLADQRLVPFLDPTSPVAEQYRALRTNLLAMRARGRRMKTLAVTSARRGDGKTITSANVAAVFAEDQAARVVIVDADLRSPGVGPLLGHARTASAGLTGYLRDDVPLEKVIVRTAIRNLDLVPAGAPLDNPTELLASARLRELIESLSLDYDFVFFDTPPVLAVTDAAILGARLDGRIFVVKMNDSEKEAVDRSLEALKNAGAQVIGAVLTNFRPGEGAYSRQRK
jgi:capsular exopolysaccharide synthesis family protein